MSNDRAMGVSQNVPVHAEQPLRLLLSKSGIPASQVAGYPDSALVRGQLTDDIAASEAQLCSSPPHSLVGELGEPRAHLRDPRALAARFQSR